MNGKVLHLVILSGKGGTGKTSLCAALAHLASTPQSALSAVLVDADVDAANLGLALGPKLAEEHEFWGGSIAEINPDLCTCCDSCVPVCRYDAVIPGDETYSIDPLACDGCAACVYACPGGAIRMLPQQAGVWFHSNTLYGDLFHAELFPGNDNSGKLVTLIKQHARMAAEDSNCRLVIIDGPPGIGCPVISASAGADLGLVVAEPSVAGIHDLKRIVATLQHFHIRPLLCINKADIYSPGCQEIKEYAVQQNLEVIGEIPFDPVITAAMVNGQPVTLHSPDSAASTAIRHTWEQLSRRLTDLEEIMTWDRDSLQNAITERLKGVIDPETGVDVIRMRLVQNLNVDEKGMVSYQFRPSSPLCPIAVPIALDILQAVSEVEGISGQDLTVVDYIEADRLNKLIKTMTQD